MAGQDGKDTAKGAPPVTPAGQGWLTRARETQKAQTLTITARHAALGEDVQVTIRKLHNMDVLNALDGEIWATVSAEAVNAEQLNIQEQLRAIGAGAPDQTADKIDRKTALELTIRLVLAAIIDPAGFTRDDLGAACGPELSDSNFLGVVGRAVADFSMGEQIPIPKSVLDQEGDRAE